MEAESEDFSELLQKVQQSFANCQSKLNPADPVKGIQYDVWSSGGELESLLTEISQDIDNGDVDAADNSILQFMKLARVPKIGQISPEDAMTVALMLEVVSDVRTLEAKFARYYAVELSDKERDEALDSLESAYENAEDIENALNEYIENEIIGSRVTSKARSLAAQPIEIENFKRITGDTKEFKEHIRAAQTRLDGSRSLTSRAISGIAERLQAEMREWDRKLRPAFRYLSGNYKERISLNARKVVGAIKNFGAIISSALNRQKTSTDTEEEKVDHQQDENLNELSGQLLELADMLPEIASCYRKVGRKARAFLATVERKPKGKDVKKLPPDKVYLEEVAFNELNQLVKSLNTSINNYEIVVREYQIYLGRNSIRSAYRTFTRFSRQLEDAALSLTSKGKPWTTHLPDDLNASFVKQIVEEAGFSSESFNRSYTKLCRTHRISL